MDTNVENLAEKYRDKINRFCLMDDTFMSKVFEDKECAELLIRIILKKKVNVTEIKTQYSINNLQGRSARLDIWAVDDADKLYNIEVQNDDENATPKRARYNSSLMDTNVLKKSTDWDKLPETYVIFITRHDVIEGNKPIYHIERCIKELSYKPFGDDNHIIYVNSSIQDETELGKLMHDFYCKKPEEMYYKELAERSGYFKNSQKGVSDMCGILREVEAEGIEKGIEKGIKKGIEKGIEMGTDKSRVEIIKKLMQDKKCSLDEAMDIIYIPTDEREKYTKLILG